MWCESTPRTASVNPQPIPTSGTSNGSQVLVRPARISASAFSAKCSAQAAAYAWKYVRARPRSMVLLQRGIFHSKLTGPLSAVFGRLICTLEPVALT
jgi:hypothetical protein